LSKLGEVVYYKTTEAPSRYYPAIVTNDGGRGGLDLTVFTQDAIIRPLGVRHGQPGEPGAWRAEEPDEDTLTPPALPGGDVVVIVTMPQASARDDLAVAAESAGQASLIEQADVVVAVWPDASYRLVKERQDSGPGLFVVKGRSQIQADEPNPELEAPHFAAAFMQRYGSHRQHISEEILADWFGAAMRGEHFPRARP
jgi:hypothetical protein